MFLPRASFGEPDRVAYRYGRRESTSKWDYRHVIIHKINSHTYGQVVSNGPDTLRHGCEPCERNEVRNFERLTNSGDSCVSHVPRFIKSRSPWRVCWQCLQVRGCPDTSKPIVAMSLDRIITDPIISTENVGFSSSRSRPPIEHLPLASEVSLPSERNPLVGAPRPKKPFYRARPLWYCFLRNLVARIDPCPGWFRLH